MTDTALAWLSWPVVVLLAGVGRSVGGSWLAPAAFLSVLWTVYLAAALLLTGFFPVCALGMWSITAMLLAFVAGALAFEPLRPRDSGWGPDEGARVLPETLFRRILIATVVLTIATGMGVVALAGSGFVRFGLTVSLLTLAQLGSQFSGARYGGTEEISLAVRAGLYASFPAAVAGGVLAAAAHKRWHRWIAFVPFITSLLIALLTAARSGLISAAVMWLGGFLSLKVYQSRGRYAIRRERWLAGLGVAGVLLVGAYAVVQWLRAGVSTRFELSYFGTHVLATWIGSIAAWSDWVCTGEVAPPSFGAITFAGPFDLTGITQRTQGIYGLAVYFPNGDSTNLYTVFRGLVDDFGMIGTWGFLFLIGALASWCYHRCASGGLRWAIPLAVLYSTILYSQLYSLFTFNSIIAGWAVVLGILVWPVMRSKFGLQRNDPARTLS